MNIKKILFICFIFFLLVIIITFYYTSKKNKNTDILCEKIYIKQKCSDYEIINNFFYKDKCTEIINEANDYADKYGWQKSRHLYFPTNDNSINSTWNCYQYIFEKINKIIIPVFSKMYNILSKDIGISEIFIVKYSIGGKKYLDKHKDGSEFSFIISLNNDYSGGGTFLYYINKHILLSTGQCLLFSGQSLHSGIAITSGERWILTGFLYYKSNNYCSNYIDTKY